MSYSLKCLLKMAGFGALVLGLCLALVVGFTGCGDDDKPTVTTATTSGGTPGTDAPGGATELVGKWQCQSPSETLEFAADGKMIWTAEGKDPYELKYTVEGDMIVIRIEATKEPRSLQFSITGNTLTTQDAENGSLTYTRLQ